MPLTKPSTPDTRVRKLVVANRNGLHARPASMLVRLGNKYPEANFLAEKDGEIVNAKSIMGLMLLAAGTGSSITFYATGDRADELLDKIEDIFVNKFGEV
jgi:phosphocarrier protein